MSSRQSTTSNGVRARKVYCYCNLQCVVHTCHKEDNRGRKFYKCPRNRTQHDCDFFAWMDEFDEATSENKDAYQEMVRRNFAQLLYLVKILIGSQVALITMVLLFWLSLVL